MLFRDINLDVDNCLSLQLNKCLVLKDINKPQKLSPMVYREMTLDVTVFVPYHEKWQRKLNIQFDFEDFKQVNIKLLTSNTKLRSFQFRFLCFGIVTNKQLYQWKIIDSDRCTFCHDHYETQEHLFLYCTVVKRFWQQVFSWYECQTNIEKKMYRMMR